MSYKLIWFLITSRPIKTTTSHMTYYLGQAKLNVNCDLQAAQVRRCTTCKGVSRSYTLPPGHKATLQIGTTYITSHLPMAVRNAMYQEEMKKHIMKLAGWDTHFVFDMVDWEARNHAGKNFRGSKKMTIIKLEFELLATFKHRSKYDRTVNNWCFLCKRLNEDFNHTL